MDVPTTPVVSDAIEVVKEVVALKRLLEDIREKERDLQVQQEDLKEVISKRKQEEKHALSRASAQRKRNRTVDEKIEDAERRMAWALKGCTPLQSIRVLRQTIKRIRAERDGPEDSSE